MSMRRFLMILLVAVLTLSLMSVTEARRFGGGKSFGISRSFSGNQHASTPASSPLGKASGASKWLAPLAGLAAGGLLASLFMGHGMGTGILSWILLLGAGFVIFRLISRFRMNTNRPFQPAYQTEQAAPLAN